jgi:hypothetical protein
MMGVEQVAPNNGQEEAAFPGFMTSWEEWVKGMEGVMCWTLVYGKLYCMLAYCMVHIHKAPTAVVGSRRLPDFPKFR